MCRSIFKISLRELQPDPIYVLCWQIQISTSICMIFCHGHLSNGLQIVAIAAKVMKRYTSIMQPFLRTVKAAGQIGMNWDGDQANLNRMGWITMLVSARSGTLDMVQICSMLFLRSIQECPLSVGVPFWNSSWIGENVGIAEHPSWWCVPLVSRIAESGYGALCTCKGTIIYLRSQLSYLDLHH